MYLGFSHQPSSSLHCKIKFIAPHHVIAACDFLSRLKGMRDKMMEKEANVKSL